MIGLIEARRLNFTLLISISFLVSFFLFVSGIEIVIEEEGIALRGRFLINPEGTVVA